VSNLLGKILSVFLLLCFLSPAGNANAQSVNPPGPVYIVQEGDSLWEIAYRFHVSQSDLELANGINDPNQITIGQPLVIPGLEGIQGELTTVDIPYGETLASLGLRYHLSVAMLARLNHITSPDEIYAGYSLVILKQDNPSTPGKRISLSEGQSLLELAVLSQTDPWTVLEGNYFEHSAQVLPGDVLRIPGGEDLGPGALPPEISQVEISTLVQGQTADIQIVGSNTISLSGSLASYALNFFETGSDHYIALQGLHSKIEPGLYPMEISVTDPTGAQFNFSQMVLVSPGDYYLESIHNVDPVTLDPAITGPEDQLWNELFTPVSLEKFWQGSFTLPVDSYYAGCYSSWYGARRSYNESAYTYVHTGQDICGQVGDPIYATANGVVAYTGELTVRGNTTLIDHGWGVYSAYMHQSEILVNVGDRVEAGQLIGRVGNTGRVDGPHLHFEVIVGGVQVDPLQWLNQAFP
jgi:murein DD-endopeptidase MepM/ murein hydrolase activator NlpD